MASSSSSTILAPTLPLAAVGYNSIGTTPAYRAALALNNMSITLLQRGEFEQATKTLGDALALVKLVFQPQPQPSVSTATTNNHNNNQTATKLVTDSLQRAQQALAARPSPTIVIYTCIQVHALDEDDYAQIRAAIALGPSTVAVFPITVRETSSSSGGANCSHESVLLAATRGPQPPPCKLEDRKEAERKFGILLYNHGLAYFLSYLHRHPPTTYHTPSKLGGVDQPSQAQLPSRITPASHQHDRSLELACRSFTLAHMCHSRCWNTNGQSSSSSQQGYYYSVAEIFPAMLLSALALSSLCEVLKRQDKIPKAMEALQAVSGLCSMVEQDFFATFFSSSEHRIMAPAA
ncbi:hypothetical protein ACA910_003528 [Epithemia clementina (nom. ined.)]